MANAGGAWDNAKKIVETELKAKGTDLHAATVVGDTVGDPFKDTSSVALNPIIKFTTLFGLLAVELAVSLTNEQGAGLTHVLAAVFLAVALVFVYRSFYGMRIGRRAEVAGAPGRKGRRPGSPSHPERSEGTCPSMPPSASGCSPVMFIPVAHLQEPS
jgi:K(+)-stimulated pyrophosphate-energized sodium pump